QHADSFVQRTSPYQVTMKTVQGETPQPSPSQPRSRIVRLQRSQSLTSLAPNVSSRRALLPLRAHSDRISPSRYLSSADQSPTLGALQETPETQPKTTDNTIGDVGSTSTYEIPPNHPSSCRLPIRRSQSFTDPRMVRKP